MSKRLSAKHIVRSRLPPLQGFENIVPPRVFSDLEFRGTLGYWSEFESEVRRSSLSRTRDQTDCICPPEITDDPDLLSGEQYVDDENCKFLVQDQFEQNVGRVMASVFESLGKDVVFGSYGLSNTPSLCSRYPDIALTTADETLLAVGQVGIPLCHHLYHDTFREYDMRRGLARIASFMTKERLRFGFITTHDDTIFLKLDRDSTTGDWILWHSNPIAASTESTKVAQRPTFPFLPSFSSTPKLFHGKVSVRECFLFLGEKALSGLEETDGTHFETVSPPVSNIVGFKTAFRQGTLFRGGSPFRDGGSLWELKYISGNEEKCPPPCRLSIAEEG